MARVFLEPTNPTHRQYEALRAYFVDGLSSAEVARRFGYTPGSFRILCHEFRNNPNRPFFLPPRKGPRSAPKRDSVREMVVKLRKNNFSVYDINRALVENGKKLSTVSIGKILREEGFARLPRRADDERPGLRRPEKATVADVTQLDLSERRIKTKFGGLFLFLPLLAGLPWTRLLDGFPGTKIVPAPHAIRALLALKLYGNARHSHVMSYAFDEGLALFAGLNAVPKRSFLTEYSCRIEPTLYPGAMHGWFQAMSQHGLGNGSSFDLDFHTIPFHGDEALVEKHYVSKRSRRQKGLLAFLVRDADTSHFCYGNAQVTKQGHNDEILRFIEYWKGRTGNLPQELIFDSKVTTYANLAKLNAIGVAFISLRRRSPKLVEELYRRPSSAWRKIELDNIARAYRTPRILDDRIQLDGYDGPIRQIAIQDLGHEEPTLLITNQLSRSPSKLIGRYAQRMIIENAIAEGIDFFHMDALSSTVPMKVDCDLQLTLMASSLYRLMGTRIGGHYATAEARRIFRDFIDAVATIHITERELIVRFQKRAHNPLLCATGLPDQSPQIPWLGNKRLSIILG